jgi:hypothetical protein
MDEFLRGLRAWRMARRRRLRKGVVHCPRAPSSALAFWKNGVRPDLVRRVAQNIGGFSLAPITIIFDRIDQKP